MENVLSGRDLKALKRQQRMIRNRESASLSRLRRKQHLESVEKRNTFLESENKQLQLANQNLLQKIAILEEQMNTLVPKNAQITPQTFIINTL